MQAEKSTPIRKHPQLSELFKQVEGRHLSDEEFTVLLTEVPDLEPEVEAARAIRAEAKGVVKKVVAEVFAQYPYEKVHENAAAKCPRDVNYVVAYASQAMLCRDPEWLDSKLLIWLKTILQSFEFPERVKSAGNALFADQELEDALAALPSKARSIYHTYYQIKKEMGKALEAEHFKLVEPYLQLCLDTLTEPY